MTNRFTRRQLLEAGGGAALAAYGLSGCTVSRPVETADAGEIVKPKIDGDLLIYNWAQYMDPALKKEFGEKYGVEVNEVNFDNLEAMVVKLRSGGQYDLIWPSTEYVARLAARGCWAHSTATTSATAGHLAVLRQPLVGPEHRVLGPLHVLHDRDRLARRRGHGMTGSWNDLTNPDGEGGCSSSTTSRRRSARRT